MISSVMDERMTGPLTGTRVDRLSLLGGAPCLDFVNTVDPRFGDENVDYLDSYPALVAWGVHAGVLTLEERVALLREGERRPAEADETLARAVELREALYRLFAAGADGQPAPHDDLCTLNRALGATLNHVRLEATAGAYRWTWEEDDTALDRVLWPVVRSAAELLTAEAPALVRACSSSACGWLFLDATKNHSRRWCSMQGCGSREKARRYYRRRTAAQAPQDGR